jgi:hypothetical protein
VSLDGSFRIVYRSISERLFTETVKIRLTR